MFFQRAKLMVNLAFNAGSSKQGNARRASVGENCVAAIHLHTVLIDRVTALTFCTFSGLLIYNCTQMIAVVQYDIVSEYLMKYPSIILDNY